MGADNHAPASEHLLTKRRVAEVLSVTPRHLQRLIGRGLAPAPDIYLGRAPRWRASTINGFLEDGRVEQKTAAP